MIGSIIVVRPYQMSVLGERIWEVLITHSLERGDIIP